MNGPPRRVLVVTGAGISAESGIPTFRGAGGYWRNRDPRTLATPEAFEDDPDTVWQWYAERRKLIRASEPNAAHAAVVELAAHAAEFLLVTQNVDDLHARAEWRGRRLSPNEIVQIHGDIFVTRCSVCGQEAEGEIETEDVVPSCLLCAGACRPGVVWFGEMLPDGPLRRIEDFLGAGPCELVLVVGTTVSFNYIYRWASAGAARGGTLVEINPEETELSAIADEVLREPAATALPRLVAFEKWRCCLP